MGVAGRESLGFDPRAQALHTPHPHAHPTCTRAAASARGARCSRHPWAKPRSRTRGPGGLDTSRTGRSPPPTSVQVIPLQPAPSQPLVRFLLHSTPPPPESLPPL